MATLPATETVTGPALRPLLGEIARLRIAVFRGFPYLYDGDADYEERYLARYAESPGAAIVLAREGGQIIGAATCLPLAAAGEAVLAPFRARGLDAARFCYFGESVLLAPWRGRGFGVAFFAAREAQARRVPGCEEACFCAVQRPADHPARPAGYIPLDAFWRKRGYTPDPGLVCEMAWKEVGAAADSAHRLGFWRKPLTGTP